MHGCMADVSAGSLTIMREGLGVNARLHCPKVWQACALPKLLMHQGVRVGRGQHPQVCANISSLCLTAGILMCQSVISCIPIQGTTQYE